jgi:UDP:flavonoid glycosyltransferase YjiC (YdhE family)
MLSQSQGTLRHIILCTVGSSGDVHPFVGLGRQLRRRGYRVTLVTAGYFRELAEKSDLEFVDTMPNADFRQMVSDPQIWHPMIGVRKVMELAVRPNLEPIYRAIENLYTQGDSMVVASTLAFGARVAQEKFDTPLVTIHLSPALFRSAYEGPRLPKVTVHLGPPWLKRFKWFVADKFAIDPLIIPWLNPFRKQLGLQPARRIFKDWWHSPLSTIAMFPEWFAAKQPDWPSQLKLCSFPLYSEDGIAEPSEELKVFLQSGPKPIAFTPGSANLFGHDFFVAAVDACQRLGRRGLLLTRFPDQIPENLPPSVKHFDFAPFRWLLPQTEMLVHHGGVGSMSQAMAAAIPQIIMPMAFDQVDNIYRVEKLGIGKGLQREKFTGPALASAISSLLDDSQLPKRVQQVAQQLAEEDGLAGACDEIESAWKKHHLN